MSKKENVPATKTINAIAVPEGTPEAWGAAEGLTAQDIIMPRMLLMQPMSDFVTGGIAKMGTIIDSLNKEKVLADDKKEVDIVVFGSFKTWIEYHADEYHATVPWSPENAQLPYEEVLETDKGDIPVTRDLVMNYYALNTEDIKNGAAFPFVIAFRRTSMRAGKTLGAHLVNLQSQRKPSAHSVFGLKSIKETNDKGTYFIFDISKKRDATQDELGAAFTWYKTLQASKAHIKVDGIEEAKEKEAKQANPTPKTQTRPSDLTV